MTQEHPVIPPQELLSTWRKKHLHTVCELTDLLIEAAQWGADRELDACCEHLKRSMSPRATVDYLRAARRPKPPSLKERALEALESADGPDYPVVATVLTAEQHALIRCALESLTDEQ